MIRTLEQRVRYDDSQCLRRLEFDGEIIPRGLVTVGTGANDQYGFNYEFNVRFHPIECPVCDNPDGRSGSIAPIRFLKQRPFDQRFARLGSPNFERLLCRVFHCGCDDEQPLLCFETGHSRREFFEA